MQLQAQTEIQVTSSGTQASRPLKRKRGRENRTKFPIGEKIVVEDVSIFGQPTQPRSIQSRFSSALGAAVRDIFDCSILRWRLIGEGPKTDLWEKILEAFSFPPNSLALVKKFTMKQAVISL
jgi:hypothetical protein